MGNLFIEDDLITLNDTIKLAYKYEIAQASEQFPSMSDITLIARSEVEQALPTTMKTYTELHIIPEVNSTA
ncbi:hypothetical protein CWB96_23195, partial [Pseudoalteromonas citrea]